MAEKERNPNNHNRNTDRNKSAGQGRSHGGSDGRLAGTGVKRSDTRTSQPNHTSSSTSSSAPSNLGGRRVLLDMLKGPPVGSTSTPGLLSETGVKVHSRELEIYGVILSIKNTFGFIQAIYEDEQYYFSEREFYDNMKVADKVAFIPRSSQKGPSAHNVRYLIPTFTKLQPSVQGSIMRCPERHRSGCGLVEVDVNSVANIEVKTLLEGKLKKQIVYRPTDIVGSSIPKNHFLDRGDLVEFTLSKMHDSNMIVAAELKLKQVKRDRAIALEIQRMLEAGAIREVGVVSTIKNKEYGFIRAQDRKEEIYFRLDDFAEDHVNIEEGMEVNFFVICEVIKGKVSDRAMHLKVIPKGTVQFEVVVGSDIAVTVTKEPGNGSNEIPGTAVLSESLDVSDITNSDKIITSVDLWQRCMPDDLTVKKGDSLLINVHFYRPEKLFFARAVRVGKYFPVGRDTGSIVALKEQAFGFILSDTRKVDLYFKSNHVVDGNGEMMAASDLSNGMKVSFDVTIEESKLRAVRVQTLLDRNTPNVGKSFEDGNNCVLKKDVLGMVIRSVTKRDAVGLIMLSETTWREIQALDFIDPWIDNEMKHFRDSDMVSIEVTCLPPFLVRAYTAVIDKLHTPTLRYEVVNHSGGDNFRNLKIWKDVSGVILPQPSAAASLTSLFNSSITASLTPGVPLPFPIPVLTSAGIVTPPLPPTLIETSPITISASPTTAIPSGNVKPPKDGFTIQYMRDDVKFEDVSSLGNDMEVYFDVYWDRLKGKKVARNIRITEETIDGETTRVNGVVEVVFDKGDRFGFIRTIPNDEKLFWHSGAVNKGSIVGNISIGKLVSFEIRRRGGMRWATNIQEVETANDNNQILSDICTAICIDPNHAVLIETADTCILKDRIVPTSWFDEAAATSQTGKQWEKAQGPPGILGNGSGEQGATVHESINLQASIITSSGRVEYKPKFFGAFPRAPIHLQFPESGDIVVTPGDIFKCQCVMNWAEKRSPIAVIPVEVLEIKASKRKGRVSKMKFKLRNSLTVVPPLHFSAQSVDFIEMLDVQDKAKGEVVVAGNVCYSYCEFSDIQAASADFTKDSLQVNDDIEYWVTSMNPNAAFGVRILPKMQFSELKFNHGPGINDQLKEQKSKSVGVATNVVMAKGPPNDSAQGFEAGWRPIEVEYISQLPWANLLAHLTI